MDFHKFILIFKAVAPLRFILRKNPIVDPDALAQLFYKLAFNDNALRQRFQDVCAMLGEDTPLSTTTLAQRRQLKTIWEQQVEQNITKKRFFHPGAPWVSTDEEKKMWQMSKAMEKEGASQMMMARTVGMSKTTFLRKYAE